jgi:hypothetical protein
LFVCLFDCVLQQGGGGLPLPGRGAPPALMGLPPQVTLDKVVSDIVAMGFSHSQVMGVVRQLQATGQPLEMNRIIDRLS